MNLLNIYRQKLYKHLNSSQIVVQIVLNINTNA